MAVLDDIDPELMRLWQLISELSDQLSQNRMQVQELQRQAHSVKGQAIHCGTGFALRRFNTDISKEAFESELERMNAHLVLENQTLMHENKQLNLLLKEYEQALDVIMGKFRAQAHSAQQYELTMARHYESLLLTSQSTTLSTTVTQSAQMTESIARLSHYLRAALRSLSGEPGSPIPSPPISPGLPPASASSVYDASSRSSSPSQLRQPPPQHQAPAYQVSSSTMNVSRGLAPPQEQSDWTLERETELQRLESENALLRSMLSISEGSPGETQALMEEWERDRERPLRGEGGGVGGMNLTGFTHARRGSGPGAGRGGRGRGSMSSPGVYGFGGFTVPSMRGGGPGMSMGGGGADPLGLR